MERTRHNVEPTPERIAAGRALREKIPREQHGRWNSVEGRPDPIDLLHTSDVGRMENLIPIRYGRMLQSPFSFYRGSAGIMAADLARTPITGLKVQACGDCHVLNFGGFATPERSIVFDINDFDETLPGPWEWDIKRLVASISSRPDRTDYPIPKATTAPSIARGCTVNTCISSPRWTRSEFGMRKPVPRSSSSRCPRACRNASRSGLKKLPLTVVPNLISQS